MNEKILKNILKLFRITLLMGLFLVTLVFAAWAAVEWYFVPQLPSISELKDVKLQVPLRVYASDNSLMAEFGEQRRIPVPADNIPETMIDAILAIEDSRFFEHSGVDFKGLLRAVVVLIKTREVQQGGSTITMQVAKNFFLSPERKFIRKFKEILLAFKIEQEFSKKEILELYLNKIFFGHRAYGIGAAAQVYYGRKIEDLTLAQYAMLAAIPKAPSTNNPISNPEGALERRNYVLKRMWQLEYITEEEYKTAIADPITAKQRRVKIELKAPYVAEMVRAYMREHYGDKTYTEGYRVYTTIEPKLQITAQNALRKALLDYDLRHGFRGILGHVDLPKPKPEDISTFAKKVLKQYPAHGHLQPSLVFKTNANRVIAYNRLVGEFEIAWKHIRWSRLGSTASRALKPGDIIFARPISKTTKVTEQKGEETVELEKSEIVYWRLAQAPQVSGALVSLNPNNGAIIALTGGFDFYNSKFNRVTQAERQPGSTFKPFIYSAALENGFTPASMVNDAPMVIRAGSKVWKPANYSKRFYGLTSLRKALTYSRNLVSVRILADMGVTKAIDHVTKFGFPRERIPKNLTIALGTGEYPPLTVARAFAVFANGGYFVEAFFVQRIEDHTGKLVYQANPLQVCRKCKDQKVPKKPVESDDSALVEVKATDASSTETENTLQYAPRVIDAKNAWTMTSMLQDVIRTGTAKRALKLGRKDVAGKTGTTNDHKDAWFSGYTSDVVTTAWVGFDKPRSLGRKETGAKAALPMWITFMREALKDRPQRNLPKPKGLVTARIDPSTGLLARRGTPNAKYETFFAENTPKKYSRYRPKRTSHKKGNSNKSSNRGSSSSGSKSRNSSSSSSSSSTRKKDNMIPSDVLF